MAPTEINRPLIAIASCSVFGFACGLFFPYEPMKLFFFGSITLGLIVVLFPKRNMMFIYLLTCFLSILKAEVVVQEYQSATYLHDKQVKNVELEIMKPPKPSKRSPWMEVSVNILGEHSVPAILLYQTKNKEKEQNDFLPGDHIRGLVKIKKFRIDQTAIYNRFDIWWHVHELTQPRYLLTFFTDQNSNAKGSYPRSTHTYRQQVLQSMYYNLGQVVPSQDVVFIAGLVFGDTSKMPKDETNAYTILGLAHILAVSGMNIELLIRPLLWTARRCKIPYQLASFMTIFFITCFGWLTGGGSSILRAVIAGDIWLLGNAFKRKPDAITSLAISCLVCLWLNPLNLADVGFQFSFMAALFLLLFSALFKRLLRKTPKLKLFGLDVFCAATAATLPIQLYVFQQWSPYSIVANLLFEPLIPVVMVVVFGLIVSTYLIFPIALGVGWIVDKILWILRVPPIWVLQNEGIYFVQMRPDEAVWLFVIYVIAAFILLGGSFRKFHFMNINEKMGKDSNNHNNHEESVKT